MFLNSKMNSILASTQKTNQRGIFASHPHSLYELPIYCGIHTIYHAKSRLIRAGKNMSSYAGGGVITLGFLGGAALRAGAPSTLPLFKTIAEFDVFTLADPRLVFVESTPCESTYFDLVLVMGFGIPVFCDVV
jgi:hypothetical protein